MYETWRLTVGPAESGALPLQAATELHTARAKRSQNRLTKRLYRSLQHAGFPMTVLSSGVTDHISKNVCVEAEECDHKYN